MKTAAAARFRGALAGDWDRASASGKCVLMERRPKRPWSYAAYTQLAVPLRLGIAGPTKMPG